MSRCIGCGAIIQSNNPEQLGYVAEAILIERGKDVYCKRCYEIRNHNFQYEVDNNLHNYYEKMKIIKKEKALILLLIDIMDIMGGFIPNLDQCIGTNKVILVVNKIDLLPKDFKLTRFDKIIRNLALKDGLNLDSILYGSVKNKEFVHKIISKVTKIKYPNKSNPFTKRKVRFNNCYIVGHASVGKSTLMNQIGKIYLEYKTDVITTNSQFQTTLDFIQWPLDKDSFLIDTPGIINPHNFCAYLKGESLHIVMPKKYIKPRTFQLQPNQTIFLGGLVRLDFKGNEKINVSFYVSNELYIHRTKTIHADEIFRSQVTKLLVPPFTDEEKEKINHIEMDNIGISQIAQFKNYYFDSQFWLNIDDVNEKYNYPEFVFNFKQQLDKFSFVEYKTNYFHLGITKSSDLYVMFMYENESISIKQDKMERLDSQQTSLQEAYELQLIDYLIHNW